MFDRVFLARPGTNLSGAGDFRSKTIQESIHLRRNCHHLAEFYRASFGPTDATVGYDSSSEESAAKSKQPQHLADT